ncbi:MAG: site-specific tyrosine recombinase XerD [Planctomycetes bacterium]|nr:site-specific tyrosine recombinase XerD [Planctomycetota bacterium]
MSDVKNKSGHRAELADFVSMLQAEAGLGKLTVSAYKSDVERFLGFFEKAGIGLKDAAQDNVLDFLAHLKSSGISNVSRARMLVSVRSFFKFLRREKYIETDPSYLAKSPKLPERIPDALDLAEVERMLSVIHDPSALGLRNKALLETLYATGARASEVCGLIAANLHLDHKFFQVFGKGNKERIVFIGDKARDAIAEYLEHGRTKLAGKFPRPELFLSTRGNPLVRQDVWRIVKDVAEKAGIKKRVYPHLLRHSFATHMLKNGADIRTLQTLLGHETIATTQVYTKVDGSHLKDIHRRFHPRS